MERWILDARYALRRLRHRPTFAVLAILTLALGVGGLTAIAGIIRSVLVNPLPYPHAEQLARLWRPFDWRGREIALLRGRWSDFAGVAAYRPKDLTLERAGAPTRVVPGIASTVELFNVLRVSPVLGRAFTKGEDQPGAAPVAILSNALWRDLGGNTRLVGSVLKLDGISYTVIGVMPRSFWFPDPTVSVWTNDPIDPTSQVGLYALVGRVADGKRVDNMKLALDRATRMLGQHFTYEPRWDMTKNASLTSFRDWMVGPLRPSLFATLGGMLAILLIACANVAALVLGQIESRSGELAVRTALGADRGRLATQLVVEVMALGIGASIVGSAFAIVAFNLLRSALPLGAWADNAVLDWSVFVAAIGVALTCTFAIALLPVLSLWRGGLRLTLSSARTGGILSRRGGLQGMMIVAEVALGVLLACSAGLLGRSVMNLYALRPGIDTRGIAVLDIATPTGTSPAERLTMIRQVTDRLAAHPGVQSVGVTQMLPLRGRDFTMGLRIPGGPRDVPTPQFKMVSRGYFATLGISVLRGRTFDGSDQAADSLKSIVVNESLVKLFFPTTDPIGQIIPGGFGKSERIIGIVSDAAEADLVDRSTPLSTPVRYYLNEQVPFVPAGQSIIVRLRNAADDARSLADFRRIVSTVAPTIAVQQATTMSHVLAHAIGPVRDIMTLLGFLTSLALVLAAIGIYGVISHFVTRRARDWSLQVALGLTPARVVGRIVRHGTELVIIGVVIGLVAAYASARFLSSLLFGVSAGDPEVLLGGATLLLLTGAAASLIPALRAGRSDPARVLRES